MARIAAGATRRKVSLLIQAAAGSAGDHAPPPPVQVANNMAGQPCPLKMCRTEAKRRSPARSPFGAGRAQGAWRGLDGRGAQSHHPAPASDMAQGPAARPRRQGGGMRRQRCAPNANIPAGARRRVDPDLIESLAGLRRALATGRSNRHYRLNKGHGRMIRKSNMEDGAMADVLWSRGEAHTSGAAREYMSMLDLERGGNVAGPFEQVCPWYGDAVRSRKQCIAGLAMRHIADAGIGQAVILGAGLDALSLEIAARTGNAVVSYEVDAATMPYKRRVLAEMGDAGAAGCVRCITADLSALTARRLDTALAKEGWHYDRPSLVVAEGITQYLAKSKLASLLSALRTPGRSSRIIMEYVRDAASISPDRAPVPEAVFGWHGEMIGVDRLSRYSDAQALDFAAGGTGRGGKAGVAAARVVGMKTVGPDQMEEEWAGSNAVFPADDSGWFAVCHGPI